MSTKTCLKSDRNMWEGSTRTYICKRISSFKTQSYK